MVRMYVVYATPELQAQLAAEVDQFGDQYTMDATKESLMEVLRYLVCYQVSSCCLVRRRSKRSVDAFRIRFCANLEMTSLVTLTHSILLDH